MKQFEREEFVLKRTPKKLVALALIVAMVFTLMPPLSSIAAGQRIEINNLYTETNYNAEPPEPKVDADVPRFTTNLIDVYVTVENITDSQITDLYYVITNMNTGAEVIEKNNKASKSGSFDIVFSNVQLYEGLNKVVVKLGEQNTIHKIPQKSPARPNEA